MLEDEGVRIFELLVRAAAASNSCTSPSAEARDIFSLESDEK